MDDSLKVGNGVYSKYSSTYIDPDKNTVESNDNNNYMSFDSYLQLLVSQMQNQDFNNPMDDSEVLAQMAQYSMLEGIKNMTQQSNISYATSLVGQVVTVDDGSGAYTGMVESVNVKNGEPWLMIDGMSYKSDKVTDVVDVYTFKNLMELIGKTVKCKPEGSDADFTGVVTNILYQNGTGYVVVNEKLIPIDRIELVEKPGEEDSDKTEGSENTDGTEGTEGSNGEGNSGDIEIDSITGDIIIEAIATPKASSKNNNKNNNNTNNNTSDKKNNTGNKSSSNNSSSKSSQAMASSGRTATNYSTSSYRAPRTGDGMDIRYYGAFALIFLGAGCLLAGKKFK